MVDEQDFTFDQMSAGMDKVIEKLKQAEKLFDNMLKTAQKLNKTKMSGVGTGASGNTGGSGTGNKSGAGSSTWDNYEKQTREAIKQMQEMASIRADLIMLDYDELEARQKVQGERVKENILLRRGNNMMVEEEKTKRAKLKIFSKMLGQTGGAGGLLSLGGIMSMGAGGVGVAGSEGGESVGQKIGDKAKDRILNYQKNLTGNLSPVNPSKGSKMFETLTKKFPKLASGIFGSKGEDGTLKGGLLGKAGKIAGKGGALGGMAGGAGGGILGAMIMKGLESSPMFQAVSKIMNQAFGLYLRPIGDFVGAFFMPIARILMLEGAANLKRGAKFMSLGEKLGKFTVALMSDPLAIIKSGVATLMNELGALLKGSVFSFIGEGIIKSFENVKPLFEMGFKEVKDVNGKVTKVWTEIGQVQDTYDKRLDDAMKNLNILSQGANGVNNGMVESGAELEVKSGIITGLETSNDLLKEIRDLSDPIKIAEAKVKAEAASKTAEKAAKIETTFINFGKTMETYKFGAKEMAAIIKYGQDNPAYAKSRTGQLTGLFNKDGTAISREDQLEKMKEGDKNNIGKFGEIWLGLSKKSQDVLEKVIEQEKLSKKLSVASEQHIALMTAMYTTIQTEEKGKLGDTKKSTILSKFNEGARNSLEKITMAHEKEFQLIMNDNNKTVIQKQEELTILQANTHAKIMTLYNDMVSQASKVTSQYIPHIAAPPVLPEVPELPLPYDPKLVKPIDPLAPPILASGNRVGLSDATIAAQQKLSDMYGIKTYDTSGNVSTISTVKESGNRMGLSDETVSSQQALSDKYGVITYDTKGNVSTRPSSSSSFSSNSSNSPKSQPTSQAGIDALNKSKSVTKSTKKRAAGGMINETIFGIGTSGSTYLFGEAGSEMIIPLNRNPSSNNKNLGTGGTNVVININIEKMSNDMDLNKIKPIVERAILETHARRGII